MLSISSKDAELSMWDNCPHFNWLDYGGRSHVAVWSDVDGGRDEMIDPPSHTFKRGIEFFGLGTFVNGFEKTRYRYGQFEASGLRVSDWLDMMHLTPKTELIIKANLLRWLDPRYLPTLMDNKPLLSFVRKNAAKYAEVSPYFVLRDFRNSCGGTLNDERARAYVVVNRFGFASLPFASLRILHWLEAQKVRPEQLRHHIDNLKELHMDLTYEPHVLPKDFATYSLDIEERVHAMREAKRLEREAKRLEEERIAREARIFTRRQIRKWLAEGRIGKRFSIVIPNTETEMVAEGRAMSNCIGGYWRNDAWQRGQTNLAFIRKDGKPYMDVEISGGKIVQARYAHNKAVEETTKDYSLCRIALDAFKMAA